MGYISITADVDINYNDIDDNDLLDIIEDRLKTYKKRDDKSAYTDLVSDIKELIEEPQPKLANYDDSVQGDLKREVCDKLIGKYGLEQLEQFLGDASK